MTTTKIDLTKIFIFPNAESSNASSNPKTTSTKPSSSVVGTVSAIIEENDKLKVKVLNLQDSENRLLKEVEKNSQTIEQLQRIINSQDAIIRKQKTLIKSEENIEKLNHKIEIEMKKITIKRRK